MEITIIVITSLILIRLKMDAHVHNNAPNDTDASSRLKAFSRIAVSPKLIQYHNFGCPLFALTTESEQGNSKKWDGHSVLRIYLGP